MPAFPIIFRRSSTLFGLVLVLALLAGAAPAAPPAAPASDPLTPAMAAEYALQAGKLDEAARWYLEAAKAADGDAVLAERATRIALLAKQDANAAEALDLWRARAKRSPSMRNAEATLALRRKDERTARRELQALMRSGEKDGWRYALVALDAGSGDPKLTGRLLGQLIDSIPDQLEAWLAFGEFSQQLQRNDLAEKIVTRVVAKFPDEPAVALLHASQLREAGKTDEARKVLSALGEPSLLSPELGFAVANEYSEMGDHVQAAAVLARGPQSDRSYILRAAYLAQAEDKVGVAKVYDELKRDSAAPDPGRRLLLGQIAEFIERHEEALEWYASVPGGPQRWQARLRSSTVLHKLKRADEAFARLRELQADGDADEETRRDAYLLEAELRKDDSNLDGELDTYARALAAFPDEKQLLYARALMWERRDDIPRAEADFRRILAVDAEDVNALNALGYTLADRTDRHQEALELIARAIAAQPDSAAIIDSYGWVLYRLGRKEEALTELRRAFTKQKDAEIAAHLAEVLWVLGEKDESRKYFEESRKIDPENRSLKRAIDKTGVVLPPLPEKTGA
ncbi:MAG: tetratricopeptide repeat protein [Xanthomonadales bacterium]|nr:tetratricopeptide repeat protein [Xanthomonadales bacterium]